MYGSDADTDDGGDKQLLPVALWQRVAPNGLFQLV